MKINAINNNYNNSFKSIRTDKNTIQKLKDGTTPILENKRINILNALNNVSQNPDKQDIEFLLDVAENIKYGQGKNSELKSVLDKTSITPEERENTSWDDILQDTINKAFANTKEDVSDLQKQAETLFATKKPLTQEQKEILELRTDVNNAILKKGDPYNAEDLTRMTNVRKSLDYFIASSEIPVNQKKECLDKFKYLLSDDYKINSQLKDKKLQVLDELLNDMLVKTPESDILTTKGVNQLYTGMCMAISVCRKAIAYENKSRYTDLVLAELDESDKMKVYDITELGTGKEIELPKPFVDYDAGERMGYRILDSAAHIWMHLAHTLGNGTFDYISYTPYDDKHYGIYNDSAWYSGFGDGDTPEKELLRALIKGKEFSNNAVKTKKSIKSSHLKLQDIKQSSLFMQEKSNEKLNQIFSSIFPEKSLQERRNDIEKLISFYKNTDCGNEKNISSRMPEELKIKNISEYIINSNPNITDEQKVAVKEKTKEILDGIKENLEAEKSISKLKAYNTTGNKYRYNKTLYKAAAAQRIALEADLKIPETMIKQEKILNLPPRDIQIVNYLNNYEKNTNTQLSKKSQRKLDSDIHSLQVLIPYELDNISKTIFGKDIAENLADIYDYYIQNISKGDKQSLMDVMVISPEKTDKNKMLKKLKDNHNKLTHNPSRQDTLKSLQFLGFTSPFQVLIAMFNGIQQGGISENELARLAEEFGGIDNVQDGINNQIQKFNNLNQEYCNILEKWQVPNPIEMITAEMEKRNQILSKKQLSVLQNKFNDIDREIHKNEQIKDLKERQKANKEVLKFSPEEEDILNIVDKNISQIRKYINVRYKELNKQLAPVLEAQYSKIGRLNGQFYVMEEGSSGLVAQSAMRIIEMMTGNQANYQSYLDDAVKMIKEGNGSGILFSSVEDHDYGFHGQYVPYVSTETFTDINTKEKTQQDILWTDNSWGSDELESYWDGKDGFRYTDYGRDFGLKNGFVLAPDLKIGQRVDEFKYSQGKVDEDSFEMFRGLLLQGNTPRINQKVYELIHRVVHMEDYKQFYEKLEQDIINGERINPKLIDKIDQYSSDYADHLIQRTVKEIKSKEDWDKLDKNDPLRFAYDKLAVYLSTDSTEIKNAVAVTNNYEDLNNIKEDIFDSVIEHVMGVVGKSDITLSSILEYCKDDIIALVDELNSDNRANLSEEEKISLLNDIFANDDTLNMIDGTLEKTQEYYNVNLEKYTSKYIKDAKAKEYFIQKSKEIINNVIENNIKITSLDCPALNTSSFGQYLIKAVDKYLNPKSDQELLMLLQGLQNCNNELAADFFNKLTEEDVGIVQKDPYDYVFKMLDQNSSIINAFTEANGIELVYQNINTSKADEDDTPDELYRAINSKLSYLDVQKYISKFKDEALRKYKARPAFPDPVIIGEAELDDITNRLFQQIENEVVLISDYDRLIQIFKKQSDINKTFENNKTFKELISGTNVQITENNKKEVEEITKYFEEYYQLSNVDSSFDEVSDQLKNLLYVINTPEGTIEGESASYFINQLGDILNKINYENLSIEDLINKKQQEINELRTSIKETIEVNILEKYRNDAFNQLNKVIKQQIKGDNEGVEQSRESFRNFLEEKFILKDPEGVLRQCIEMLQAGQQDTMKYKALRAYLLEALEESLKTSLQYKLIKNQHEGMGSKIKSILPAYRVYSSDGEAFPMDSDLGMIYIVNKLGTLHDNNETLNLFLNQSGLTDKAFTAVVNNIDFEGVVNYIDDLTAKIDGSCKDIIKVKELFDEFAQKSNMNYSNANQAIENMYTFFNRKLDSKNSAVNTLTLSIMKEIIDEKHYANVTGDKIPYIIDIVRGSVFDYIREIISSQIDMYRQESNMLTEKSRLLYSINIEDNSKESELLEEKDKEMEKTLTYIVDKYEAAKDLINNTGILSFRKAD